MQVQVGLKHFGNKRARLAKAFVCVLAVVQLLFSSLLALNPSLHKAFHHDSNSPGHECLATLLANGQAHQAVDNRIVAASPLVFLVAQLLEPSLHDVQRDLLLPTGRAPPLV